MTDKKFTYIQIDGVRYGLGPMEDDSFVREVETYLNDKIRELKSAPHYGRMTESQQRLNLLLNLAEDVVKARQETEECKAQLDEREVKVDDLAHRMVDIQMGKKNGRRKS